MNDKVSWSEQQRGVLRRFAHDVRTPLTTISGFAELLAEDSSLSSDARENVETIRAETVRLANMFEEFVSDFNPKPQ